jgi:DNA polymerase-3 subunit gamma/tau
MSSQSLYRKWRSQTFSDLVGQEPIIRTLKNALSSGKLAHAYLFTGPRGTGKTSTARLLAKTINCADPVNGEPCNKCLQCLEITAGNSFNVIEIDAASNRGIDSIRDLRDKVMMPPSTGKYKVYVLDEAHMLTTEAFNALLKTLEEPPPYAVFVLATTDVHKMLPTVLSRCQRFDFKRITTRQIVEHLEYVAGQEHVQIERAAVELIARAAAGGMRDALSLLDQAIAYAGDEISLAQVQAMLGVADPRAVHKLITDVGGLDSVAVLHFIHELSEAGTDLRQLNLQVGEYWRALMLAKAGADIAIILDRTEDEVREMKQAAHLFTLEELTESARNFAQNELMQKGLGTPQLGLELAFLQSIELHRRSQDGQYLGPMTADPMLHTHQSRSTSAEARSATSQKAVPPVAAEDVLHTQTTSRQASSSLAKKVEVQQDLSVTGSEEMPGQSAAQLVRANADSSERNEGGVTRGADSKPSLTLQQVKDAWDSVKKRVRPKNAKTAAMLNSFTVIGVEGTLDETVVVIQAAYELHHKFVQEGERTKDIDWALSTEFRQKCRVRLLAPGAILSSPSVFESGSFSSNTAVNEAPPQSARRERPAGNSNPRFAKPEAESEPKPDARAELPQEGFATIVPGDLPGGGHDGGDDEKRDEGHNKGRDGGRSSPVVKKNIVRENTGTESIQPPSLSKSSQSSLEIAKQKAISDPVVKEVMKTFQAKIVDIRLK